MRILDFVGIYLWASIYGVLFHIIFEPFREAKPKPGGYHSEEDGEKMNNCVTPKKLDENGESKTPSLHHEAVKFKKQSKNH